MLPKMGNSHKSCIFSTTKNMVMWTDRSMIHWHGQHILRLQCDERCRGGWDKLPVVVPAASCIFSWCEELLLTLCRQCQGYNERKQHKHETQRHKISDTKTQCHLVTYLCAFLITVSSDLVIIHEQQAYHYPNTWEATSGSFSTYGAWKCT